MKETEIEYDLEKQIGNFQDRRVKSIHYDSQHYMIPTDLNSEAFIILTDSVYIELEDYLKDHLLREKGSCNIPDIAIKMLSYEITNKKAKVKLLPKRESLLERLAIADFLGLIRNYEENDGSEENFKWFLEESLKDYTAVRVNQNDVATIVKVNKKNRETSVVENVSVLNYDDVRPFFVSIEKSATYICRRPGVVGFIFLILMTFLLKLF